MCGTESDFRHRRCSVDFSIGEKSIRIQCTHGSPFFRAAASTGGAHPLCGGGGGVGGCVRSVRAYPFQQRARTYLHNNDALDARALTRHSLAGIFQVRCARMMTFVTYEKYLHFERNAYGTKSDTNVAQTHGENSGGVRKDGSVGHKRTHIMLFTYSLKYMPEYALSGRMRVLRTSKQTHMSNAAKMTS